MFKKIIYLFIITIISLSIVSCEKDDYTGDSTLVPRNSTGTLTFDLPTEIEDTDGVFEYTVTVDPPQVVDLNIPVRALPDGTATEGEDFTLDHNLFIPAFTTTASGSFTVINDCDIDSGETVVIEIGNPDNTNLNLNQSQHNINLKNFESGGLDVYCTWDGMTELGRAYWNQIDTIIQDQEFALCDYVDIDMYLFDADGTNLFGYDGATASCIEHLLIEGLEDGTYELAANLWASGVPFDSLLMQQATFPISVNFDQCGLISTTETQSEESAISNLDLDYYMGGSVYKTVAEITVTGNKYSWVMR